MKFLTRILLAVLLSAASLSAQPMPIKNLRLLGGGGTTTVESGHAMTFLSGSSVTFNAGTTVTISGVLAGTPSGGTLNLTNITLTLPATSGASLTNLNASNLGSGTVPDARFPATLPAISGANLTLLNASNLASGTMPVARMPALTGGDASTPAGSGTVTLATVNSNVGTFGSATAVPQLVVNGKGLVTAAGNVTITPAVGSITGLGTGVATALAATPNATGGVVLFGGNIGNASGGTLALTGTLTSTSAAALNLSANGAGVEVGGTGASATPFIDFHSSGVAQDYDARILASGGGAGVGQGNLTVSVNTFSVSGNATVSQNLTVSGRVGVSDGSAASPTIYFTADADTGFSRAATDSLEIAAGGVRSALFTPTGVTVPGNVTVSGTGTHDIRGIAQHNRDGHSLEIKSLSTASPRAIRFMDGGGTPTKFNWQVGAQINNDNYFEITPSTAAAGSTFTSPAVDIAGGAYSTTALRVSPTGVQVNLAAIVKGIRTATAALDFPSIAAGSSQDLTMTVTGASTGDTVTVNPAAGGFLGNIILQAIVSSANTVTVRAFNITGGAIDPSATTVRATVISF